MGSGYFRKVLNSGPIAYWPQWERSGGVAQCLVRRVQDGAYTGVTLGQPGIGDGNVCPFFDGLNDYTNIYSAALAAAFNGSEGAVFGWLRITNPVWNDGNNRFAISLRVDVNNWVYIRKNSSADDLYFTYVAGGTAENLLYGTGGFLGWISVGLTWSKSAERVDYYYNGLPVGFDVNLGNWVGALGVGFTFIGTQTAVTAMFQDYLAHWAIWDYALSPATIAELSRV
jgi:hypothetical protein